jgi:hypothetical protein
MTAQRLPDQCLEVVMRSKLVQQTCHASLWRQPRTDR